MMILDHFRPICVHQQLLHVQFRLYIQSRSEYLGYKTPKLKLRGGVLEFGRALESIELQSVNPRKAQY